MCIRDRGISQGFGEVDVLRDVTLDVESGEIACLLGPCLLYTSRLRYRYLDLRRPEMAARLRLRSDFTFAIRSALHDLSLIHI